MGKNLVIVFEAEFVSIQAIVNVYMGMKTRPIYDLKQRKIERLLKDRAFIARIKEFKSRFSKFGCPIPPSGFRSTKEFEVWWKGLGTTHGKVLNSKKYKNAVQKITKGQKRWGQEEQDKLEQLRGDLLPPVAYGETMEGILEEFGLDPANKLDMRWLDSLVFFNKTFYPHSLYKFILSRDNKEREQRLFIQVFPRTKLSDIPASELQDWQKHLPGYRGRNRPKDSSTAVRDKKVVDMYIREKKKLRVSGRERSKNGTSVANKIWLKLKGQYPELSPNLIKKIVLKELQSGE